MNSHKRRANSVSIADVAQEFVSPDENRKRNFSSAGNFKKYQSSEGLVIILTILDSIISEDVYVIFVEVVNKMARKCKINGETSTSIFLCTDQIFYPYDIKMVSAVPVIEKFLPLISLRKYWNLSSAE